ncbi:MAG: SURF1 family protein [Oceanicoccus sp.]|uniref:SURF1 family protein n=1 Tax=Oceanicoccus sp. TaxID=2691044 RepID=UPI0026225873|nr:SURF1 family protein [Oceanicoccus sp.]MCP3909135.1 SURF1 family protein [Oceanicoccus sp.]MDG1773404.1 SURF1 family protein [Oceanicoccus sp.]
MSDLQSKRLQFTPNWRASLLAVLLLPVVISLGFWQLDRAEEKRQLQDLFEHRQLAGPVALEALNTQADLRYQPVTLRGEFVNEKAVLLDNRIYQGRFGYEIITPFRLVDSKTMVLVNRGWLEGDISRRSLPAIKAIAGEIALIGEVYVPQGDVMLLADESASGWPRVMQSLNIEALQKEFEQTLFPYSVRIKQISAASYTPNWVVVNLQPEKHTGYAVQWFAMAVALLVIGLLANTNLWSLIKRNKVEVV